jgi:pimeloyl-ACP methyl ester carboxylesterase
LPVILCHGLGLNATFWTLTDNHLPFQLTANGYDVFVFDLRGSGENAPPGWRDRFNRFARQTPLLELGEREWNIDDLVMQDVPAILDYVAQETGQDRVNWVGHSLGGMMMFPYLELSQHPERIANFVGMGATIIQANTPQTRMLRATKGLRGLLNVVSTGRIGRPLMYFRFPGLENIDRFYYTSENVDKETISRFYGYTLEDPGPGALKQLAPYLRSGHLLSAFGEVDYSAHLGDVVAPTLMIASDSDLISDVPSTELTFEQLGSPDKTLVRLGKRHGNVAEYGHCDLVWSRHAPDEVFPIIIQWLDARQPRASAQSQAQIQVQPSPQAESASQLLAR